MAPPSLTPEQFWARGFRSGDCLLWTGSTYGDGRYGSITYHGRQYSVHRLSWMLSHGPIPNGLSVLHTCDTPACFEPTHLFLGTQADNIADRERKGRSASTAGTGNGNAKLTEEQVADIRRRSQSEVGRRLAEEYGVSPATISEIKNGRHWR